MQKIISLNIKYVFILFIFVFLPTSISNAQNQQYNGEQKVGDVNYYFQLTNLNNPTRLVYTLSISKKNPKVYNNTFSSSTVNKYTIFVQYTIPNGFGLTHGTLNHSTYFTPPFQIIITHNKEFDIMKNPLAIYEWRDKNVYQNYLSPKVSTTNAVTRYSYFPQFAIQEAVEMYIASTKI